MQAQLYAVMQCLSVRLSVMFVDSVKMNEHIFKIFSPSVAPLF